MGRRGSASGDFEQNCPFNRSHVRAFAPRLAHHEYNKNAGPRRSAHDGFAAKASALRSRNNARKGDAALLNRPSQECTEALCKRGRANYGIYTINNTVKMSTEAFLSLRF